jgi:hypothetical protein
MEALGVPSDSAECIEVSVALHRELGLRPWDSNVLEIDEDERPGPGLNPIQIRSFELTTALRRQLLLLTRPPARVKASSRRQGSPPTRQCPNIEPA